MRRLLLLTTGVLTCCLLGLLPVWAAPPGLLPPAQTQGPVTYVRGGIGPEEAQAFAAAIALTALGDIGIWATWNGYLPWPWSSMGWYVWFLASGAYALGPAYQVHAFRSIIRRAHREDPPEHFEAGVQAI